MSKTRQKPQPEEGDECGDKWNTWNTWIQGFNESETELTSEGLTSLMTQLDAMLMLLSQWDRPLDMSQPSWSCPLLNLLFSLLDLEAITDQRHFYQAHGPQHSVMAMKRRHASSLTPRERHALEELVLDCLTTWLRKATDRVAVFRLWIVILPDSTTNPYERSLLDKLTSLSTSTSLMLRTLNLLQSFVDKAGTYFIHIEKKKGLSCTSFTPLYQNLGDSLARTLFIFNDILADPHGDISLKSQASKTLSHFLKFVPLKKIALEPIITLMDTARRLVSSTNPVSQICGLNLMLHLSLPQDSRVEHREEAISLFGELALRINADMDRNIRYVCLQNLGQLAASEHNNGVIAQLFSEFQCRIISLLNHDDHSLVLHVLRLLKIVAKYDLSHSIPHKAHWAALLKANVVGRIQNRRDSNLESAYCDCLAEIPELIFDGLPPDKQMVLVSFVLSNCRASDQSVSSSCFRCLGVLASFKYSQSDVSFLVDCTQAILDALETNGQGSCSLKNPLINITWALANLSDTLAEIPLSDVGYPWPSVFRLLAKIPALVTPGQSVHVNTKVNCLRAMGCLLRCVNLEELSQLNDEQLTSDMLDIGFKTVLALNQTINQSQVMKVKWNGCYALGHLLRNSGLLRKIGQMEQVMTVMLGLLEHCHNFKVLNTICQSLCYLQTRVDLGIHANEVFLALVQVLDLTLRNDINDGEIAHKMNLTNSIVLALAHLFTLSDGPELVEWNELLSDDQWIVIGHTVSVVRRRLSPEKATLLLDAQSHSSHLASDSVLCRSFAS
ncbi:hypothetical protein TCAL_14364 [Tigriopus californicus]|uniref:HEAT repeat-containing protein 6 n=1 Tax=Tigriopus californicus TaxID=6832 RepID=A0A553NE89_TIGCA|nr:uncharacterized protein LOC131888707 [Tigriopus californicus]TRY63750.1 hypothetical protein TCAL_14364 [Tigriopus californicus]